MQYIALIQNDAVVLGLLMSTLGLVFYTSSSNNAFWQKFYKVVPSVLLCYFIPSLYNSFGLIDGEESKLYPIISRYILPVSLVLLTISIDFPALKRLGGKALIMFLAGTVGIVLGGPLAVAVFSVVSPETVGGEGPDAVWRGLSTIAGSWIGGSANQTAMKEVFGASDKLFSAMITMDVIVANIWMAFLLYGAGISKKLDAKLKADASAITALQTKLANYQSNNAKIPSTGNLMIICAIGFGVMGLSHLLADWIAPAIKEHAPFLEEFSLTSVYFWIIVLATTGGLLLSLTSAKNLEGVGASKVGTLLLYVLVASVGMKMDVLAIFDNPLLFGVGILWMAFHVLIMLVVAKLIKAPFFFVAVGSQANVGGAASAPIVASAFAPSLAPVGVLLAVLGYALGTYGAYLSGLMMKWIVGG
ncbi:MAG: DUF819 family protein [Bacteroidetes bacterium]|jgi:Predicted integral membrane protein|uniref:DUF819 family protein n=1 Tax=Phnomibacter sp. TaxID=2836217 RepID=UPI002FDDCCDC|nr:DUF819 family protein [Bacteroidota bacterium]